MSQLCTNLSRVMFLLPGVPNSDCVRVPAGWSAAGAHCKLLWVGQLVQRWFIRYFACLSSSQLQTCHFHILSRSTQRLTSPTKCPPLMESLILCGCIMTTLLRSVSVWWVCVEGEWWACEHYCRGSVMKGSDEQIVKCSCYYCLTCLLNLLLFNLFIVCWTCLLLLFNLFIVC